MVKKYRASTAKESQFSKQGRAIHSHYTQETFQCLTRFAALLTWINSTLPFLEPEETQDAADAQFLFEHLRYGHSGIQKLLASFV